MGAWRTLSVMTTSAPRVLVVQAHPDPASFHAALADAYAAGASTAAAVEQISLAELDFDPVRRGGFQHPQELEPDLLRVRAAMEAADHVTWVFPTWWAGPPAQLKGLVDRAFTPGWAFRYDKGQTLPTGLLRGRSSRIVTAMDSPSWWYALAHRRSIHASFGTATLTFVGFAPVRATTIYGQRDLDAAACERAVERVRRDGERDAQKLAGRKRSPALLPAA